MEGLESAVALREYAGLFWYLAFACAISLMILGVGRIIRRARVTGAALCVGGVAVFLAPIPCISGATAAIAAACAALPETTSERGFKISIVDEARIAHECGHAILQDIVYRTRNS